MADWVMILVWGEFIRDDTTGRSVVDYAIGTPVIYNSILVFKVLGKFPKLIIAHFQ